MRFPPILRIIACALVVSVLSMTGCAAETAGPAASTSGVELNAGDFETGGEAEKAFPIALVVGVAGGLAIWWVVLCIVDNFLWGNCGSASAAETATLADGEYSLRFDSEAERQDFIDGLQRAAAEQGKTVSCSATRCDVH